MIDQNELHKRIEKKLAENKKSFYDKAVEAIKYSDRKYECLKCGYKGHWEWIKSRLLCPSCGCPMTEPTGKVIPPKWYDGHPHASLEWQDNAKLIQE